MNYFWILFLGTFIFLLTDASLYMFFTKFIFKKKKINNKNLLYNYYYLIFKDCEEDKEKNESINIWLVFSFYLGWLFLFIICIKFMKYNIIYKNNYKFNYVYLTYFFILLMLFQVYYGSYSLMRMPSYKKLLDKYLTLNEKKINKKNTYCNKFI